MVELRIYMEEAVTMLRSEGAEEKERWLDWVLAHLLHPDTNLANISANLKKELFSIFSTVFLHEIHRVTEANPPEACSDQLVSCLLKGKKWRFW